MYIQILMILWICTVRSVNGNKSRVVAQIFKTITKIHVTSYIPVLRFTIYILCICFNTFIIHTKFNDKKNAVWNSESTNIWHFSLCSLLWWSGRCWFEQRNQKQVRFKSSYQYWLVHDFCEVASFHSELLLVSADEVAENEEKIAPTIIN